MAVEPANKRLKLSIAEISVTEDTSSDDFSHLLCIFSTEVWCLILANVNQAHDFHKIRAASQLFNTLLLQRRTQALFGSVFKIIAHHQQRLVFQNLPNFRRVCRSWKRAVDSLNDQKTIDGHFDGDYEYTTRFQNFRDFDNFHKHFNSTHLSTSANPLITRRVVIDIPPRQQNLWPCYEKCLEFLDKYGQHVWYFKFTTNIICPSKQYKFYKVFKFMLQRMPNLKGFRVFIGGNTIPEMGPKSIHRLVKGYKRLDLPTQQLTFINQVGMPFPIFKTLIRSGLPNLKNLEMRIAHEQNFRAFFNSSGLRFRLTKLKLDVQDLPVAWSVIFHALERHFGETLEQLDFWPPKQVPHVLDEQLKLPKLKNLQLVLERAVPLDFLLGTKDNLEKLGVLCDLQNIPKAELLNTVEHEIKFYGKVDALHESNMWTLFKKLKWMDMVALSSIERATFQTCSRDEWEIRNQFNI